MPPNSSCWKNPAGQRNDRAAKAVSPRVAGWAQQHRLDFRPVDQAEIQKPAQIRSGRTDRANDGAAAKRKPVQCRFTHLFSLHPSIREAQSPLFQYMVRRTI